MSDSIASGRQKRQKLDKNGKFAALQRLKELKGSKNKYEVSDVDRVYEEVDEREYGKKVLERADDWIVDDDGSGYVEDGRDIFDDDLDDESISKSSKNQTTSSKKASRHKLADSSENKGSSNIRNMLMSMPVKRKVANVKLEDDDVLGDIMSELNSERNSDVQNEAVEMSASDYLKSFRKNVKIPKMELPPKPKQEPIKAKPIVKNDIVVKSEPISPEKMDIDVTESQRIDDFDSNDGFPTDIPECSAISAANDVNWEIEDFDSQELGKVMDNVNSKSLKADSKIKIKEEPGVIPFKIEENSEDVDVKSESGLTDEQMSALPMPVWEASNSAGPAEVSVDLSKLPLTTNEKGDQVLRLFWLDAYEDPFRQPGIVYLFGKVWIETAKSHVSCCVAVKNIDRRIYLLPREEQMDLKTKKSTGKPVSLTDVYNEFNNEISKKFKLSTFKSRKVTKSYAFSLPDVPASSEYLEVKYPASCGALPSSLEGSTFSRVFGTPTNSLELLLIGRRIKGPCWLDLCAPEPVKNPTSWCKVEACLSKPEHVSVYSGKPLPPPPIVVASLSMRTVVNPKTHQSEIVMIGCLVHHEFHLDRPAPNPPFQQHFCAFTKPCDMAWPLDHKDAASRFTATKFEKVDSERALLGFFLAKFFKLDPDLLVGHDISGFDLEVLMHRIFVNKIPNWSRMGRLRRANPPQVKGRLQIERNPVCGRLVCDVKISAKELIRCRSYDLSALCEAVLKLKEDERRELSADEIRKCYTNSREMFLLITCTMQDATYIIRLMYELNVMPLAMQITNIAGNLLSRTLMGGRSERNEYLLLHAFTEKDYIVPDKEYKKNKQVQETDLEVLDETGGNQTKKQGASSRRKPAYSGGLVLDPKKGFYDKLILLMDFNSLYPSIIQEYNICFTTVNVTHNSNDDIEPDLPPSTVEPGILPTEIRKLVESRREVKKLMKNPDLSSEVRMQYNIRQTALKLTANSMYGCLGFSFSRFYAKPLAALVTAKGREILISTKDLVQKLNYEVIYGDTDSIMINTNCLDYGEVFKIGHKIKAEVNKLYRQVELDVDGVFKYMLLLKKKKYAAVTMSQLPSGEFITSQELKGLDIVRRDWSQISAEAGKFILSQILSDMPQDDRIEAIHAHLVKLREDLEEGKVPIQLLAITKQLTKNPEEYVDHKNQPHVLVAMRLNSRGGKRIRSGDTVAYVICDDGSNLSAMQRAYHVDELKTNKSLKVDVKYYLAQQIHPVVSRLCDPIDGTDAARIAECLGLDPTSYRRQMQRAEENEELGLGEKSVLDAQERFRDCDKFKFKCRKCAKEIVIDSPYRKTETSEYELVLEKCPNSDCDLSPLQHLAPIQNALTLAMRTYVQKYYACWLVCEDPACPQKTRRLPLRFQSNYPICNLCEKGVMFREYTDTELYTQLSFFQHIFDLSKIPANDKKFLRISVETDNAYCKLKEHVEQLLKHSAYSVVNMSRMFEGMYLTVPSSKGIMNIKQEIKQEPL
ncbi:DNA polymerase alpha catalytic subunit isoform X1 [Frankliniella occidentalis]|uniref:DNA polymerase n=1 Tax=Frankliniella occidentalis TaxID=133901 RepID=A0A9C6U7P5_FRAOC|nr:DNA polymerase alpha catalytic subunit isoform X1 [Frankliniella occidentalis]